MDGQGRVGARQLDVFITGYKRGPVSFETVNGEFRFDLDRVRGILAREVYADLYEDGESQLDQQRIYNALVERADEIITPDLREPGDRVAFPAGEYHHPGVFVTAALSEPYLQNELSLETAVFVPELLEERGFPVHAERSGELAYHYTIAGDVDYDDSPASIEMGTEALKLDRTLESLSEGARVRGGWNREGQQIPTAELSVEESDGFIEEMVEQVHGKEEIEEDEEKPRGPTMDPEQIHGTEEIEDEVAGTSPR